MSATNDIIYRARHPNHRGTLNVAPLADSNISCGDHINLYVLIVKDRIQNITYDGNLCFIGIYGAELLIDHIIGLSKEHALATRSSDLLPTNHPLLSNPTRLRCFDTALRALAKLK